MGRFPLNMSGRWMSPDSYSGSYDFTNPQTLNRYAYVNGQPLGFTDPSGQDPGDGGCNPDFPDCGGGGGGGGCDSDCGGGGYWPPPPQQVDVPRPDVNPWDDQFGVPYPGLQAAILNAIGFPTLADVGCLPICDATQNSQNSANIVVNCRGIQTYDLGALGFQHCDAQVTDCSGVVHSLSAGPNGTGELQAWNTPNPSTPFTGTTVYSSQAGCSTVQGLIDTTNLWHNSPMHPKYSAVFGPNSNIWLQFTFLANGIQLPINGYGSIW